MQLVSNLFAINLAIYFVDIASYELLGESLVRYFSINLIFLFWYWFLDYLFRNQQLVSGGIDGKDRTGIPYGILFPEEAMQRDLNGSGVWVLRLVDYFCGTSIVDYLVILDSRNNRWMEKEMVEFRDKIKNNIKEVYTTPGGKLVFKGGDKNTILFELELRKV
jgi:hypothetical protein